MKLLKLITASLLFSSIALANGNERLELNYFDLSMKGRNTLHLKQKIKDKYGIKLANREIVRVKLVAKTKNGEGTARLVVGDNSTHMKRVYGTRSQYNTNAAFTYDKLTLDNPSYDSHGVWQIKLHGHFKIKRVVVVLKKQYRPIIRDNPRQYTPGRTTPGRIIRRNPPQYNPLTTTVTKFCSSFGFSKTSCYVGHRIVDVDLVTRYSINRCVYGYDWGFNNSRIWVKNGCDARFRVTLRN